MKAMILAAGLGTRMKPLTDTVPKPLLKVGDKSLIEHQLFRLREADFSDIVINTAYLGEQIETALGNGSAYGVNIEYSREGEPLETAGAIYRARPLLGEQPFLLVNGDVLTDYPLRALSRVHPELGHLVLVPTPDYLPNSDFSFSLDRLSNHSPLTYTYSGISVLNPLWFDSVDHRSENRLGVLFRQQIDRQQEQQICSLTAEIYQGQWLDVGTPERLKLAHQLVEKGS